MVFILAATVFPKERSSLSPYGFRPSGLNGHDCLGGSVSIAISAKNDSASW